MNYKVKIVPEYILKRRTVLSFMLFFFCITIAIFSWYKLQHQPKEKEALASLRSGLETNEWIFSHLFSDKNLSRVYAKKFAAARVRVNGDVGLKDTTQWQLNIIKNIGDTLKLDLADLKKLPKTTITFDFKCIEGWNQITNWSGVKFSDFIKYYKLTNLSNLKYVGMQTPDSAYYVGIDMASMMHPQTILAYEMNGAALPSNQGYPLRLIIPVKYGVKHIKKIGSIYFANEKPKDYWYELGYDYYCGM
jgi:DMSO/TMAO reductase YedYZ molybdopterin-dependent catalytic subunit